MASPIQIVLNPENYEEARDAGGGGGRKDFFAHRDAEFTARRRRCCRGRRHDARGGAGCSIRQGVEYDPRLS